jgi:DNA-binding response OmpR family regulator
VTLGRKPVELTVKEFDLNVIDVHIARLRCKIDDGPVKMIQTIRGVGFMLSAPAA